MNEQLTTLCNWLQIQDIDAAFLTSPHTIYL